MRRLTLILSDLYLPEEAGPDATVPEALALPQLEWLLRFAQSRAIPDWRRALSLDVGRADLAVQSSAVLAARDCLHVTPAEFVWLATPVRLEARLDHVRMLDRGMPRLAPDEREQLRVQFARAFAPAYALHDAGPRGFLLTGLAKAEVTTVDPARLLDADIGRAQPSGAAARELRRLAAEIEMWMHGLPGKPAARPSALWLWGGGPHTPAPARTSPLPTAMSTLRYHGDDPGFAGLARATTGAVPAAVPADFAAAQGAPDRVIVEMTPMNGGADESLSALDARWFAPARAALSAGELDSLDVVANDRWFRIAARPSWRFWRRRVSWLGQLRAAAR